MAVLPGEIEVDPAVVYSPVDCAPLQDRLTITLVL